MTTSRYRNGPRGPYNPYASERRGDGSKTAKVILILAAILTLVAIVAAGHIR